MTESVSNNIQFNDIVLSVQKANPNHNIEDIIFNVGKLATEIYYQKIVDLILPSKLDKFKKAKLRLHRYRETQKGQERIDTVMQKDENILKYENFKKKFEELLKFHSSTDKNFKFMDMSIFNGDNSTHLLKFGTLKELNNKNDIIEYDLYDDPQFLTSEVKPRSKNSTFFRKRNFELESEYSYIKSELLKKRFKGITQRKISFDPELVERIKATKLEKIEKPNLRKFDLRKFIGIIKSDEVSNNLDEEDTSKY